MEISGVPRRGAGSQVAQPASRDNLGFDSRWGHDRQGQQPVGLPEIEEWRPIPRAPGYEASSLGRIRRIGHDPLKPRLTRKGREIVDVAADGRPIRTIEVHTLVADAFIGPRPLGLTIDHLDTDYGNNAPDNLEYVTNLVNQQRRWARVRRAGQQIARAA